LCAWLIYLIAGNSFLDLFRIQLRDLYSVPTFISVGILFGILIIYITELPYFDRSLSKYRNVLAGMKLNYFHVFFLSFCAGFGEEVFFRGAIQPYAGIWITAIFFVAIHGYFSFKNKALSVFGIGLTLFIVLLGWAAREYSIWHAIAAHFSYDLVLLMYYRKMAGAY
jgi:membrane protease YdiL (CAAX protease family)